MPGFGGWLHRLLGHDQKTPLGPSLPDEHVLPGGLQTFAQENNEFAVAMYEQLRHEPGNIFLSPFSIRTALALAVVGARGETAVQIKKVLRMSSADELQHRAFGEVIQRLNLLGEKCEIAVANSLWGQDGEILKKEFLDLIARYYDGGMHLVDFRHAADAARVTINQWVEERTRRKIQDLIPGGGTDADTRLVLANAVYFKGMWLHQFGKDDTREGPFYLADGRKVKTQLMHRHGGVRYMQGPRYKAVELEYLGRVLSMLVLLPDRRDGLGELEQALSARMLDDCVAQMGVREVKIFLPRFKITWGTLNVDQQLRELGMPLAFTRFQADFSGINGCEPPHEDSLFLSAVFHKAFVGVDEQGTEAAAATAVCMPRAAGHWTPKPPPVPVFRADHPFLFAIRDRDTGTLLFLGRTTDPTREC